MSDYSLDELLDLIEGSDKKETERKQVRSVIRFIEDLGIEGGDVRVPPSRIYYEYKMHWNEISQRNKCSKIAFFRTFKQLFKQKRTKKQRYYMLNDKINTTPEALEEADNYEIHYLGGMGGKKKRKR